MSKRNGSLHPRQACIPRAWCFHPGSAMLLVVLFVGSGMTDGNCQATMPPPGGPSGGPSGGPAILPDDHVIGDANAKVTVVEYEDFQ